MEGMKNMNKKAALHNLGCKVNAYETESMQQMLEQAGYEIVPFAPGADIYIINTCTVTNIADRKSRQMLHKAKKMNPEAVVVAADVAVKSADVQLMFMDRFCGSLIVSGRLTDVQTAVESVVEYFGEIGFGTCKIHKS